jgi:quinoprotein glucose dehydrogenase
MSRTILRTLPAFFVLAAAIVSVAPRLAGQAGTATATGQPSTKNGEWPMYTADLRGSKYSPLDQINAANFNKLEVAWRFKTDSLGPRPEYKLEGTPLMVKGVVYATAGTRRSVVALDAKTGELMWAYSLREGNRAAIAPRQLSGRGLSYWTDGRGDDRIIFITTGYRMVALNAHTGSQVASFGKNGIVDLKEGVVYGNRQPINLDTGEIGLHSTPTVVGDVVLVGSSFKEGFTVVTHNNSKGLARAFDVRTGKTLWTFNTIPRPGEVGSDTWENDSWAINGNTGVWTQITADPEAGLVYLPVESPTSDLYGGHRPGNNLFGETLVAVDLKTGVRKWHFQFVHHPIWDMDMSSAPLLIDTTVEGRPRKLVAVPSKQAWLYVFDRITGQPIWPIEERPVPQSTVPGEKTSPTQPHVTKPPAYARNFLKVPDDVIDFTPEMRAQGLEVLKRYKNGPLFNPAIVGDINGIVGALQVGNAGGGTNWPGGSFDEETGIVYVQANNSGLGAMSLRKPPSGFSDMNYVSGREGTPFQEALGPGFGTAADSPLATRPAAAPPPPVPASQVPPLTVEGLPLMKPPYGVLSAINLERGDLMFQVPHGDTPDAVRQNPKLQGLNIPKTGQAASVGLMVTKTLVILGDPQVTAPPGRPRGAMLRAYNKQTGAQVGEVWMPAPQSGSPMTYSVDGRQYIIVAVSGGNYSGEYISFALPQNETRPTQQGQH